MTTSRELVAKTIKFENFGRMPLSLPPEYGNDFAYVNPEPSPEDRPLKLGKNVDEWGAVWDNIGTSNLGEVVEYPLNDWADFEKMNIPDIRDPERWQHISNARKKVGDKFLIGSGISLYERTLFIRGLENTWMDIYQNQDKLCKLLDILVDMNLYMIEQYSKADVDGLGFCDDWGLQDRLMISPEVWRKIWKPRYDKIYKTAHKKGLFTFLHSCGYIVEILDDFIEIGLDVIQMDQQENMGLELLGERFAGKITFWSPVDIQAVMGRNDLDEIRTYCRRMYKTLSKPGGGFIPKWYPDSRGAGHKKEAVEAMCDEFLKINNELQTKINA